MSVTKLPDFEDLMVRMTNHVETTSYDVDTPGDVPDPDPCPPDMDEEGAE